MLKTGAARARPLKLVTKGALKMHTSNNAFTAVLQITMVCADHACQASLRARHNEGVVAPSSGQNGKLQESLVDSCQPTTYRGVLNNK
ncbi:hypothetical protein NDU88_001813 [Pleurodeles waltl]|uniref:Uncharacterized protein n=1 Tax=Pleurodeles waltl TaxID=8319 RepID=A0AAV7P509_PLEWA|nr:hypothetical protein NDU88_001813 [Pleurodeles waltl]